MDLDLLWEIAVERVMLISLTVEKLEIVTPLPDAIEIHPAQPLLHSGTWERCRIQSMLLWKGMDI